MKSVTPIGVMIVIVIVAILAVLIIPQINKAKSLAEKQLGSNLYVEELDGHEYVYVVNYSAGGIMHKVNCKCTKEAR